jgi:hypothetical protein
MKRLFWCLVIFSVLGLFGCSPKANAPKPAATGAKQTIGDGVIDALAAEPVENRKLLWQQIGTAPGVQEEINADPAKAARVKALLDGAK